jgi:hypothetical protein
MTIAETDGGKTPDLDIDLVKVLWLMAMMMVQQPGSAPGLMAESEAMMEQMVAND